MKKNSLIVILIFIIMGLLVYIIYDKLSAKDNDYYINKEEAKIVDEINLDYVSIYLSNDGYAYIVPLSEYEIDELNAGNNLKERLTTLYGRAFYFDIYKDNYKIKGFRVKLDEDIKSIKKVVKEEAIYIVFIKENNTIGVFDYEDYYNMLNTKVIDNFNNIKNVLDIVDNKIIYLDGSSSHFNLKK